MSKRAKVVSKVGLLAAVVGGVLSFAITGSPQMAIAWSAISVPAPALFAYLVLHP